jgi:hypothetical protein
LVPWIIRANSPLEVSVFELVSPAGITPVICGDHRSMEAKGILPMA